MVNPTSGKMMYHLSRSRLGRYDDPRRERQLAVESVKIFANHDEHEHRAEHERCEREDNGRVDHRALDAALELRLLFDLVRDAVEDVVEHPRRLAGLHHRDVQLVEHLRVARHRLGEQQASLDVGAELRDNVGEIHVVGLLLEDHE
jgi:hypothetical protein